MVESLGNYCGLLSSDMAVLGVWFLGVVTTLVTTVVIDGRIASKCTMFRTVA